MPVGRAGHHQSVHRLDAPALLTSPPVGEGWGEGKQTPCQPIEQFGMRRRRPGFAEIAERLDDAGAEVMLPDGLTATRAVSG